MRLFIAINLDNNIRDALAQMQESMRRQGVRGNYTKIEKPFICSGAAEVFRHVRDDGNGRGSGFDGPVREISATFLDINLTFGYIRTYTAR